MVFEVLFVVGGGVVIRQLSAWAAVESGQVDGQDRRARSMQLQRRWMKR